jgi:hypothetical protein
MRGLTQLRTLMASMKSIVKNAHTNTPIVWFYDFNSAIYLHNSSPPGNKLKTLNKHKNHLNNKEIIFYMANASFWFQFTQNIIFGTSWVQTAFSAGLIINN